LRWPEHTRESFPLQRNPGGALYARRLKGTRHCANGVYESPILTVRGYPNRGFLGPCPGICNSELNFCYFRILNDLGVMRFGVLKGRSDQKVRI
jgi:hypothetical protein